MSEQNTAETLLAKRNAEVQAIRDKQRQAEEDELNQEQRDFANAKIALVNSISRGFESLTTDDIIHYIAENKTTYASLAIGVIDNTIKPQACWADAYMDRVFIHLGRDSGFKSQQLTPEEFFTPVVSLPIIQKLAQELESKGFKSKWTIGSYPGPGGAEQRLILAIVPASASVKLDSSYQLGYIGYTTISQIKDFCHPLSASSLEQPSQPSRRTIFDKMKQFLLISPRQ